VRTAPAGTGPPEPPRVRLVGGPAADPGRPGAADVVGSDRRPRRRSAVLVAWLLLAGLAGARADAALAERELDTLLERAAAGLSTVGYSERRIQGTVGYFSPALVSPSVDQGVRDSLQGIVRDEAAGQVPALREDRDAAAAVRVLPWHAAEREARDRWVAYLDSRIAFLEAVSAQFRRLYQPRPEQEAALAQAREAFTRAGAAEARTAAVFDR